MIPDATAPPRRPPRARRLAIVGNGMAACRLLDELARRGAADRYAITVFGEEKGGAYNRVLLSRVLGGAEPDAILTKPPSWYERHRFELVSGAPVTRLDPARKTLVTKSEEEFRYDVAVLATGSVPTVPPIEGMTGENGELRDGVFVYRTMDDCLRMRRHARAGDTAVVLGGGLLGLEAAKVLCDVGLHVTVVHVAQTILNAQLDALGGEMLRTRIERLGIFVRTGHTLEAVVGQGAVEGVVLDDGETLPADMLVLACGVRPRVELAKSCGLPINRGILVNDAMATQAPGVYALGECAEHRGRTYGLVAPAWEQAAVLADVLTGANPGARYAGSTPFARLKVAGVDVASMGCLEPELESDAVLQVVEERRTAYRKLVLRDGRLIGAMLVGDTTAAATLVQALDRGQPLPADPLEALCTAPPASPRERLVCTCHKVTDSHILQSLAAGATSVEAVGAATGAGTGCGSCRSEIARLVTRRAGPPPAATDVAARATHSANGVS
ncbi:MAG: FAD-dependent oxidoreductase [Polyangiaceae bacterium]|nr:FAD-dependent oxidoreductase [Polyangiaceae bacterium]